MKNHDLEKIVIMPVLKVAVIGATGGTGRAVIENALVAGYETVAAARRPEAVKIQNARLEVRRGDVSEPDSICRAVAGADAVISAIGSERAKESTRFYSEAVTNIIYAITEARARRLICVGAGDYIDEPRHPFWIRFMMRNLVPPILRYSHPLVCAYLEAANSFHNVAKTHAACAGAYCAVLI